MCAVATKQQFCIDRHFSSAEECSHIFDLLGCGYRWVQLSRGPLRGRLRIDRQGSLILISVQANQALLVQGDRNQDWIPFTIEHSNNIAEHRHFGESLPVNALGGFNTALKESMYRTSPGGSHIGAVLIERERVEQLSDLLDPSGRLLERLEYTNMATVSMARHAKLKRLMDPPIWRGEDQPRALPDELLEAMLFECLSLDVDSSLLPMRDNHRLELMREFVELSFQSCSEPLRLVEVCKALYTTKTTLNVGCSEMFGVGPMSLMKQVRLQQVHYVLCHQGLQRDLNCTAVNDVACMYGFRSRNHFASDYRQMFDETPKQTLERSKSLV